MDPSEVPPERAVRQKPVASLESALGNQRALVNALDYVGDLRDLEALACTSAWRGFAGTDLDEIFPEECYWRDELYELEDELRGVTSCTTEEWRETYREQFLKLLERGKWLKEPTILTLPAGAPEDEFDLEAEAARRLAEHTDCMYDARWTADLLEVEDFTSLAIAKLACRARRWRDPFGEGADLIAELLAPGWTLPPRGALRAVRASPFVPQPKEWSSRGLFDDIIYQHQGKVRGESKDEHRDIELRRWATLTLGPGRVPSVGTSLLNLGGALDAERARAVRAERQRHADGVAARWTDRVRAAAAADKAIRAANPNRARYMDALYEREELRSFEILHRDLFDVHRDVLAEVDYAQKAGDLPEAICRAIRERYIPLAHYEIQDNQLGERAGEGTEFGNTVVFTFATKGRVDPIPADACRCCNDAWACQFLLYRQDSCRDGIGGETGELFMRQVNYGISGAHAERDAHHVWKWRDSCTGEWGPSQASDYCEELAYMNMHRSIMGYFWDDGPKMEPNHILRALLLCSGYGFSREPRASAQHHTHDILPRGAASHTECVTGWSILQKTWERDFGTPGVSHAAECVFAADEG